MNTFTALVLAGSRQGGDAFAAEAGATHKALIEVGGVTMIERVVRALRQFPRWTASSSQWIDRRCWAACPACRRAANRS
jgi:molybdopterin-guanine dinucleotide biosynthesis protein A